MYKREYLNTLLVVNELKTNFRKNISNLAWLKLYFVCTQKRTKEQLIVIALFVNRSFVTNYLCQFNSYAEDKDITIVFMTLVALKSLPIFH